MIGRIRLLIAIFSAVLLFVGCTEEQTQSGKQEQPGEQETSSEVAAETTAETTAAERTATEESREEVSSPPPEERSPDEVLALQYEYINRGDFDNAYSLFAEQSQQEVSLAQYRAFFEDNAPYSVTDYSFSAPQAQGDSATVEAEFTVNSASGVEQLQRTQRFVRENGEWRVVMRPEQVAAFTATSDPASSAPMEEEADQANAPSKSKVEAPERKQAPKTERGVPASEIVVRISGTAGIPYEGDISGRSEARDGQQPIEGTIGQGQNEYRLSDIVGDVQVRNVQAGVRKSRPGIEGDLRVEILHEGVVMADKVATGTAGSAVTSWNPGLP